MASRLSHAVWLCVALSIGIGGFAIGRTAPALPAPPHMDASLQQRPPHQHPADATADVPPRARPLRLGVIGDSLTLPDPGTRADSWLRLLVDTGRITCGDELADRDVDAGAGWRHAWAASGATTQVALDRGWVAEAARALRNDEIDALVVMIGIDDLALFQGDFLRGVSPSAAQWDGLCDRVEANWLRMAHALQVGRGLVIFSEIPDPIGIPAVNALLRADPDNRSRLQAATRRLNAFLNDLTASRNLPLFDFIRRQQELAIDPAAMEFPGLALQPLAWGADADCGFAPDGIHLGPLPTGVLAAGIVEVLNCYRAAIAPLPRTELAARALAFTTASHRAPSAN